MRIIEDPAELSSLSLRRCGFVPTMGALHEGHGSLVRRAAEGGRPVVVSIFVNPTQFGPKEDYARYPRTLDSDCALLEPLGVAAVFVPSVEAIYPRGLEAARVESAALALPDVATMPGLEDSCRPGHLAGVALVVGRLFDLVGASAAYFGEKDFQQLRLVEDMVEGGVEADHARFGGLKIVRCATIREKDGLAMSSRNRYLSADERIAARGRLQVHQAVDCRWRARPSGSKTQRPPCTRCSFRAVWRRSMRLSAMRERSCPSMNRQRPWCDRPEH